MEVETNQLCILHVLKLENGIVTSDIFLHLSLYHQNIALALNIGVKDFVGTRVE